MIKTWWIGLQKFVVAMAGAIAMIGQSGKLLVWNEFKETKQLRILNEGIKLVTNITPDPRGEIVFDPKLNGKLVHVNGFVKSSGTPTDPDFGIMPNRRVLALRRIVDMFQWKEYEYSLSNDGSTVKYHYRKEWSATLIKSDNFYNATAEQHNPESIIVTPQTWIASNISLPEYPLFLSSDVIEQMDRSMPEPVPNFFDAPFDYFPSYSGVFYRMDWYVPLNKSWCNYAVRRIPEKTKQLIRPKSIQLAGKGGGIGFYIGKNPKKPQIGDIRVTYSIIPEQRVSVIGQQKVDGSLTSYSYNSIMSRGTLLLVKPGDHNASEILNHAISTLLEESSLARGKGVFSIFLGFMTIVYSFVNLFTEHLLRLDDFLLAYVPIAYMSSIPMTMIVSLPIMGVAKLMTYLIYLA